ncbi:hypothetical protein ACFP2F_22995 [Hymenobacter artigasi]|uniref:Uncharacterized protein n=1 Tax=Hymenobacter artigasi TaxID=2719616 RepID=A0ABX1HPD8_9BACT|nr:hypothetical protein [Hymenobacter artigasi]NKI92060.1 hypothetical protein [Hymenobacter artigasi]
MTGNQLKRLIRQTRTRPYRAKIYRGDPTRPAYTLYCLWKYPTYLAAMNELDELVDQWPQNQPRTVALLAVRQAFFDNGATHWEVGMVHEEDQENVHGLMLNERRRRAWVDPGKAARHAQNFVLAEAALVERERRKQGPPTGKKPQWCNTRRDPKRILFR